MSKARKKGMTAAVLYKYRANEPKRDRVPIFLKKYKEGDEFVLIDNTKVVLVYQPSHAKILKARDAERSNKLVFLTKKQSSEGGPARTVKLGDFAKTTEFGGTFGSVADDGTDTSRPSTLQHEIDAVNEINAFIKKQKGEVNLHIANLRFPNVESVGAVQVDKHIKKQGGTAGVDPKADIIIYKTSNDYLDTGNIFISHKKSSGKGAGDFHSYSGVSIQAGTAISQHREVQAFLRDLIEYIGEDGLVFPVMRNIADMKLKNLAVFGPGAGNSKFGLQNVQLLGQGQPAFSEIPNQKNTFNLKFDGHMTIAGHVSTLTGEYEPVLGARYAKRGFVYNSTTYTGCRIFICPLRYMANRTGLKII